MCLNDRDRFKQEWENNTELNSSISEDEYIYNREVEEYGPCDDELGTDDNEDY